MPTIELIRRRFMQAIEAGKTTEEATAIANGLQAPAREPGSIPPPLTAEDYLAAARAEYTAATGKRYYHGWDAAELRRRIAEAANASA